MAFVRGSLGLFLQSLQRYQKKKVVSKGKGGILPIGQNAPNLTNEGHGKLQIKSHDKIEIAVWDTLATQVHVSFQIERKEKQRKEKKAKQRKEKILQNHSIQECGMCKSAFIRMTI